MLKTTHNSHAEVIERIAMSCRFACFLTSTFFLLVSSFQNQTHDLNGLQNKCCGNLDNKWKFENRQRELRDRPLECSIIAMFQ